MIVAQIERLIGARGINPHNSNLRLFELTDRLDGNGPQLTLWDESLGELPSLDELALAANPTIELTSQEVANGFEARVTIPTASGLVKWRCIAPTGQIFEDEGLAANGIETWAIDGPSGSYLVQAWSDGHGFAQITVEL